MIVCCREEMLLGQALPFAKLFNVLKCLLALLTSYTSGRLLLDLLHHTLDAASDLFN